MAKLTFTGNKFEAFSKAAFNQGLPHKRTFRTEEEFAAASGYFVSSQTTSEAHSNLRDWRDFLENCMHKEATEQRMMLEMGLHRKMLQTSAYFVHHQNLELDVLAELNTAVDLWVFLALHNALDILTGDNVKAAAASGGTAAEVFLAFMDAYRLENQKFCTWTLNRMIRFRYKIYEAVAKHRNGRKRNQEQVSFDLPSAKRQKSGESSAVTLAGIEMQSTHPPKQAEDEPVVPLARTPAVNKMQTSTPALQVQDKAAAPRALFSQEMRTAYPAAQTVSDNYHRAKIAHKRSETIWCNISMVGGKPIHEFAEVIKPTLLALESQIKTAINDANFTWTLEKGQRSLNSFTETWKALEKGFKDFNTAKLARREAINGLNAAAKELQVWEGKKKVVEQAWNAIQALKNL